MEGTRGRARRERGEERESAEVEREGGSLSLLFVSSDAH